MKGDDLVRGFKNIVHRYTTSVEFQERTKIKYMDFGTGEIVKPSTNTESDSDLESKLEKIKYNLYPINIGLSYNKQPTVEGERVEMQRFSNETEGIMLELKKEYNIVTLNELHLYDTGSKFVLQSTLLCGNVPTQ